MAIINQNLPMNFLCIRCKCTECPKVSYHQNIGLGSAYYWDKPFYSCMSLGNRVPSTLIPNCMGSYHGQILIETATHSYSWILQAYHWQISSISSHSPHVQEPIGTPSLHPAGMMLPDYTYWIPHHVIFPIIIYGILCRVYAHWIADYKYWMFIHDIRAKWNRSIFTINNHCA